MTPQASVSERGRVRHLSLTFPRTLLKTKAKIPEKGARSSSRVRHWDFKTVLLGRKTAGKAARKAETVAEVCTNLQKYAHSGRRTAGEAARKTETDAEVCTKLQKDAHFGRRTPGKAARKAETDAEVCTKLQKDAHFGRRTAGEAARKAETDAEVCTKLRKDAHSGKTGKRKGHQRFRDVTRERQRARPGPASTGGRGVGQKAADRSEAQGESP